MRIIRKSLLFLIILLLLAVSSLRAFWVDDGVPVSTAINTQFYPEIVIDGAGGAIIVWMDLRGGYNQIYAQRIDAGGNSLWTVDGIPACTATPYHQYDPEIVSDGVGGTIIAWYGGNGDIYGQRIDKDGNILWPEDGLEICIATDPQWRPRIIPDGSGGAIITWMDFRGGSFHDIYAQLTNGAGNRLWANNGAAICTAADEQANSELTTDGSGGAIIAWDDMRDGNKDIYAQCIDVSGSVLWTADGVAICTEADEQGYPQVASDGNGGAIITWEDFRSGVGKDIYAQRIDSEGDVLWTADGVAISTATGHQDTPQITSDGDGGAILTWQDRRNGIRKDIYAQRIDAGGSVLWTVDGIAVCTATSTQQYPLIKSDETGGAFIYWEDMRNASIDIYIQRIDAGGSALWTADGVAVCTASEHQQYPKITSDGDGGAIITWHDRRVDGYTMDIYAQQISHDGITGYRPPYIHSVLDIPGDEGGYANVAWRASRLDYSAGDITHYTIWRAIDAAEAALMVADGASLFITNSVIHMGLEGKNIRREIRAGTEYFWSLVDSHDAYYLDTYAIEIATLFDSTAACADYHYFQVIGHTSDPQIFFISPPDSGYSVDNLAPAMPTGLTGKRNYLPEGLNITWSPNGEDDLDCYNIYRGATADFIPAPGNLIASQKNTMYFDGDWRWDIGYYYKLSAIDIHGNESQYAVLGPTGITGEQISSVPPADRLYQNYPNPFNPVTSISFDLEQPSFVSLKIFDTSGRLVRVLVEGMRKGSRHEVVWDGRDDAGLSVTSGMYLYRISAGSFTETRKMVLLR